MTAWKKVKPAKSVPEVRFNRTYFCYPRWDQYVIGVINSEITFFNVHIKFDSLNLLRHTSFPLLDTTPGPSLLSHILNTLFNSDDSDADPTYEQECNSDSSTDNDTATGTPRKRKRRNNRAGAQKTFTPAVHDVGSEQVTTVAIQRKKR